jgi:hypothetical protein
MMMQKEMALKESYGNEDDSMLSSRYSLDRTLQTRKQSDDQAPDE